MKVLFLVVCVDMNEYSTTLEADKLKNRLTGYFYKELPPMLVEYKWVIFEALLAAKINLV